jgi:hypothetical protein
MTEYLVVTGSCALLGIAAFHNFGGSLHEHLDEEAEHIHGRGMPNAGDLLDSVLDIPDFAPPCSPLPTCLADMPAIPGSPVAGNPGVIPGPGVPGNGNPTEGNDFSAPGTTGATTPVDSGEPDSEPPVNEPPVAEEPVAEEPVAEEPPEEPVDPIFVDK